MIINWAMAILIVVFAVGLVLFLLGMSRMARYGESILSTIGGWMMFVCFIVAVLGIAGLAAYELVSAPAFKVGN